MAHRALQIINQVAVLLVANGTWGDRVHKARARSVSAKDLEIPGVFVFPGADVPVSEGGSSDNMSVIDSELMIMVTAIEEGDREPELLVSLFEKRSQIHIALMADIQLGLPTFVSEVRPGEAEPKFSPEGERIVGAYETRWFVQYRMNFTDPN